MSDHRDAALRLAERGVPVFPCGPDKAPRVTGGFKAATTDPDTIRGWDWNSGGTIGAAVQTGQIVVDVDPRNGGLETLQAIQGGRENPNGKRLDITRTVRTRSGGTHHYFTVPEGLELRSTLGPGIDIKRAGRGYVIVPPSDGYSYVKGGEPVPAPQWLLEELVVERDGETSEPSAPKYFAFEQGTPYGVRAMESELGRLATAGEGGRNNALNAAAYALSQLASGGELDGDVAVDKLLEVAEQIGLEHDESMKTINSGWRAGEQFPRQAPPKESGSTGLSGGDSLPRSPAGSPEAEGRFWVDWEIEEGPLPFYCTPLLPKSAYVLVYGATEAAKSMAWAGLLAQGSHHGVRASIYSLENPPSTDRDRLRRWAPDKRHFRLTNEHLDFNDVRQVEALIKREEDWGDGRGTDVIMIDTYSHAFSSHSDDGNAKAIEFAVRVRFVMQQVGCSVVVVDHTGYAHDDEPRDASAKRQQVDVAILMKKAGDWRPGQPARFTMKNNKAARFANPFFLTGEIRDVKSGLELGWTAGPTPTWEAA